MFTTIAASVLINAAILCFVFYWRGGSSRTSAFDEQNVEGVKSEIADLLTDLNHVANTHVNAIESRKDELMRVLEAANRKIVRINSLISDLQIMEGRLEKLEKTISSTPISSQQETVSSIQETRPGLRRGEEIPQENTRSFPVRLRKSTPDESFREHVLSRQISPEGSSPRQKEAGNSYLNKTSHQREREEGYVTHAPSSFTASVPPEPRDERKVNTIVRLAREGWAPEDIAAHVRMGVNQVRQVLGLAGREYQN